MEKIIINANNYRYEHSFINSKGERVSVWISNVKHDKNNKNGLMNLWVKNGFLNDFINETLHVDTYVYDEKNNCSGKYNPQIIPGENKINFAWILPATPENISKIIKEVIRLANRA